MSQTSDVKNMLDEVLRHEKNRVRALEHRRDRLTEVDGPHAAETRLGLSARDCERWTFTGAAMARVQKEKSFETECDVALRKQGVQPAREMDLLIPDDVLTHRCMDVSPGSKGGSALGDSSQNYFDTLRNRSVAFQCGMQFAKNQIGNVSWPRRTSAATSAWLVPGVGVTDTDPAFSQLSATPRTLMAYAKHSMQFDAQISPAIEMLTRNSLVNDQAAALDLAVLNGTGGAQPLGILNAGIGTASGASIDFAKIVKMQTDVADANGAVNFNSLAYVAPPLTAGLLKGKQRFSGTDSPIWSGGVSAGTIEGVTALATKHMPAGVLVYGDFSQLVLVEWGAMALAIDPSTGFNTAQIGIRLLWQVDTIVLNLVSFQKLTAVA